MKLIMENWKRFLSENKKEGIRNLKYGELKKRKHKRPEKKNKEIRFCLRTSPKLQAKPLSPASFSFFNLC